MPLCLVKKSHPAPLSKTKKRNDRSSVFIPPVYADYWQKEPSLNVDALELQKHSNGYFINLEKCHQSFLDTTGLVAPNLFSITSRNAFSLGRWFVLKAFLMFLKSVTTSNCDREVTSTVNDS